MYIQVLDQYVLITASFLISLLSVKFELFYCKPSKPVCKPQEHNQFSHFYLALEKSIQLKNLVRVWINHILVMEQQHYSFVSGHPHWTFSLQVPNGGTRDQWDRNDNPKLVDNVVFEVDIESSSV